MNKRYVLLAILVMLALQLVTSCKKSFLNVDLKATQTESNYYKNASEAFSGLVAAYDPMGWEGGTGSYANFACLDAASDECYGGGGSSSDVPYLNTMDSYSLDA